MSRVLRSSAMHLAASTDQHQEDLKHGLIKANIPRTRKPVLGDRTNLPKAVREEPMKKALQDRTNIYKANAITQAKKADDCVKPSKISKPTVNVTAVRIRAHALKAKQEKKAEPIFSQHKPATLKSNFEEVPMEIDDDSCDDQEVEECLGSPDEKFLFVSDYAKHIFQYLRSAELKFLLPKTYMEKHALITSRMRYILVDWLCTLHNMLELDLDTLHLTSCLLDQYLNSGEDVTKENLQLIGLTALFVASKFEDIRPTMATELSEAVNSAITSDEILKFEIVMLRKLDFNISIPLPITFYRRLSRVCHFSTHQHFMGKYLLEICLVEADLCYQRPSMLAAAVVFLVSRMFGLNELWTDRVERSAFYTELELHPIVTDLAKCVLRHTQPSKYRAIRNKYALESNYQVSSFKCIKSEAVLRIANFL